MTGIVTALNADVLDIFLFYFQSMYKLRSELFNIKMMMMLMICF